jgi:hypothetical protein
VNGFWRWWEEKSEDLADLGFHRDDPRIAVGHVYVAHLDRESPAIRGMSEEQIMDFLGDFQMFKSARVHDMDTLKHRLHDDPAEREALLAVCERVLDEELGRLGVAGTAIRNALQLARTVQPALVQGALTRVLDDVLGSLEPLYTAHRHRHGHTHHFRDELARHPAAVADALLRPVDAIAARNPVAQRVYQQLLRPRAQRRLEEVVPHLHS